MAFAVDENGFKRVGLDIKIFSGEVAVRGIVVINIPCGDNIVVLLIGKCGSIIGGQGDVNGCD